MKTIQVNKKHQVCFLFTLDDGREYHAVKSHFKIIEEGEDSAFFFPEVAAKARKEDAEAGKEFKEPKIKWRKSKAKAVLYELIRDGTVPMEKDEAAMSIDDIYLLHLTLPFTTQGNF